MSADIYEGDQFDNTKYGSYTEMYGYGGADSLGSNRYENGFVKIFGGDGDDQLQYYGGGQGQIYGGNDDDLIYGNYQRDKLYGDKDDDDLYGFSGNDVLYGGKGDDDLYGGYGKDKLYGGKGHDYFGFDTPFDGYTDAIKDFNTKDDYVTFDHSVYKSGWDGFPGTLDKDYFVKGSKPKDSDDYYGYDSKKGILWYDSNGSNPGNFQKIAKLDEGLNFTHKDIMLV